MNTISESINSVPIAGHPKHIVTIARLSIKVHRSSIHDCYDSSGSIGGLRGFA